MQPKSGLRVVPPAKSFRPRDGQRQFLTLYAADHPPKECVGQCPTGYGKTVIAAMAFRELVAKGMADRMLFVVAGDQQAEQARRDFAADCKLVGLEGVRCWLHNNSGNSTLASARGDANVFVATVQTVAAAFAGGVNPVQQLLTAGNWFVACDEFHHYGEGRAWGDAVKGVRAMAANTLALSATPYNRQTDTVFGEPDVRVTYLDALKEGAVKEFELKAARYTVTFEDKDGTVEELTTCQLRDRNVDDAYLKRKKLRVVGKYVEPILRRAVNNLVAKRAAVTAPGVRLQMIVRVHACFVAKRVAESLAAMVPEGYAVDWVGTGSDGRADAENHEVLARFIPGKDAQGRRVQPDLDVLVQVGMCGEGADTVSVVEMVDLSLSTYTEPAVGDRQFIGRGARVIVSEGNPVPVVCTVWVPSDSPLTDFLGRERFRAWIDSAEAVKRTTRNPPDPEDTDDDWTGDLVIDTQLIRVRDVTLDEILEGDHFMKWAETLRASVHDLDLSNPQHLDICKRLFEETYRVVNAKRNEQVELADNVRKCTEQINHFISRMFQQVFGQTRAEWPQKAGRRAVFDKLAAMTGLYTKDITSVQQVTERLAALATLAAEFNRTRQVPGWFLGAVRPVPAAA